MDSTSRSTYCLLVALFWLPLASISAFGGNYNTKPSNLYSSFKDPSGVYQTSFVMQSIDKTGQFPARYPKVKIPISAAVVGAAAKVVRFGAYGFLIDQAITQVGYFMDSAGIVRKVGLMAANDPLFAQQFYCSLPLLAAGVISYASRESIRVAYQFAHYNSFAGSSYPFRPSGFVWHYKCYDRKDPANNQTLYLFAKDLPAPDADGNIVGTESESDVTDTELALALPISTVNTVLNVAAQEDDWAVRFPAMAAQAAAISLDLNEYYYGAATNFDADLIENAPLVITQDDSTALQKAEDVVAEEWPAFCDYASLLCTAIAWFQMDEPLATDPPVSLVAVQSQSYSVDFGVAVCPAPRIIQISALDSTGSGVEFSFDYACQFASGIKPFVVAIGFFLAGLIIVTGARKA